MTDWLQNLAILGLAVACLGNSLAIHFANRAIKHINATIDVLLDLADQETRKY